MEILLSIAAKSLLVAGGTLLLLQLARKRSAADRSWIAHLGLVALLLLPVASYALPALEVPGPSFLAGEPDKAAAATLSAPAASLTAPEVAPTAKPFPADAAPVVPAPVDWQRWSVWLYLAPAGLLFLLTLIAVGRLIGLKARSQVLVDTHWLSALARAQRRMGFKNGTALLTSDELRSPVSWGLMRPVIVLSNDAADAHGEAEAIIAHELAHVARLDWAKLLLARVTVALFWFNPLVWLLAREAHQLREEAADDAVLGSDIDDTDYARLLVGIARHECRGLLLGAHGVAPAKNSLARRVKRVLDKALTRAPGGWRWSSAAAFFAAGMAVPVAALNFVPTTPVAPASAARLTTGGAPKAAPLAPAAPVPAAVATAAATAAHPHPAADEDSDHDLDIDEDVDIDVDIDEDAIEAAAESSARAVAVSVAKAAGAVAATAAIDEVVAAKVHGVTPAYANAIRSSSPAFRRLEMNRLTEFRMHGVSAELVRELGRLGTLRADEVTSAAVHGVTPAYARTMVGRGYARSVKDLIQLRIFGVTPEYADQFRRAGFRNLTAKQFVKFKTFGIRPEDIKDGDP